MACSASATILGDRHRSRFLRSESRGPNEWPSTFFEVKDAGKPATSVKQSDRQQGNGVESSEDDVPLFRDDDSAAWGKVSSKIAEARASLSSIPWSSVGDQLADRFIPEWAQQLPHYVSKIQSETEMKSGSLADEIWQEAQDVAMHPEIGLQATVRISNDLCAEELDFIKKRKNYVRTALARYLGLQESQVDPRDVPTIAICGSGGGLRAMVSGAASCLSAQEAGLLDCATYTAGVSGSCWLQALYNSTIGGQRHDRVVEHLKQRIGTHIAYPPAFLELLTRLPTSKYVLSGTVERLKGDPKVDFGLVDVYGLLLATRLLIPKDELDVYTSDLKLSHQRRYLGAGAHPLPIYAAIRHELHERQRNKGNEFGDLDDKKEHLQAREKAEKEGWFQWFEITPYELFCEEISAGIPTWSIGRHFKNGKSINEETGLGLPELRMPFLMGIFGSAFCATLSHYYKEIRPLVKGLAGFEAVDDVLQKNDEELTKLHPVNGGAIPNPALGLEDQLSPTTPQSIFKDNYIKLMDAGMSNNLPIYPLLRHGRDVDIIICFDASADIKQENWLSVVDGYAKQRGLKGWPVGAGWPAHDTPFEESTKVLHDADDVTPDEASARITEAKQAQQADSNPTPSPAQEDSQQSPTSVTDLGYCNIWVGKAFERSRTEEPPPSKRLDSETDWEIGEPNAGTTVIYFPFIPNSKVEGVDPASSSFMSTWNFVYTPEQIDSVVALARANFDEGKDQTMRAVRAVYERKKAKRLDQEAKVQKQWRNRGRE